MAMGHWVSRIVLVAAELKIADHLASGPRTAEELAGPTGAEPGPLYRFLRGLANLGILTESGDRRFGLTPVGEALRTGAPGSARASILTIASDWWVEGFRELGYSVRTGKSGFEKALGMPIFDYLAQRPEAASFFSETMIGVHGEEPAAIAIANTQAALPATSRTASVPRLSADRLGGRGMSTASGRPQSDMQ
jgi:hypothetical protein